MTKLVGFSPPETSKTRKGKTFFEETLPENVEQCRKNPMETLWV